MAAAIFGCRPKVKDKFTDTLNSGVIPIAVDETFEPIIEQEIGVFESIYQKTGIVPQYMSELDAIQLLLHDSVRLAITTRPLSDNEVEFLKQKKFQPRLYKLATDGIALIVNRNNPDTLITVGQLRQILTGEILNWTEIYPTSKLGKISLVFDNKNSSTVRYAIDSVCAKQELSGNVYAQQTNREVLEYVAKNKNAIGVIGVSWLNNKIDTTNLTFNETVRVMAVSNELKATKYNSYQPVQYYLLSKDYPLIRSIYIILNDPRSSLPSGFTNFLTSDRGQRIILKAGLVPATQPIRVVQIKEE